MELKFDPGFWVIDDIWVKLTRYWESFWIDSQYRVHLTQLGTIHTCPWRISVVSVPWSYRFRSVLQCQWKNCRSMEAFTHDRHSTVFCLQHCIRHCDVKKTFSQIIYNYFEVMYIKFCPFNSVIYEFLDADSKSAICFCWSAIVFELWSVNVSSKNSIRYSWKKEVHPFVPVHVSSFFCSSSFSSRTMAIIASSSSSKDVISIITDPVLWHAGYVWIDNTAKITDKSRISLILNPTVLTLHWYVWSTSSPTQRSALNRTV